jgi:hypothetical protein
MLEHHESQEGRGEAEPNTPNRKITAIRPVADREVPLPSGSSSSIADVPVVVHKWLDGEVSERVARYADAKNVDLWNRISAETMRRGRMTTPSYMPERIMAVLPPKASPRTEILFKKFSLSPAIALLAAAGLLVAGIFIGRMMILG